MDRKKRIALYGGTFDPIHLGHLEVARKVSRLFEIDELWFVVAQVAPHKAALEVTPALHRYAMLALATQDDPRLLISTFELDAPGPLLHRRHVGAFQSRNWTNRPICFLLWERIRGPRSRPGAIAIGCSGWRITSSLAVRDTTLAWSHITSAPAARIVDLARRW